MTYGCQLWSLNKQLTNKLRTAQRAMETNMFNLKLLRDQEKNKDIDIIEYTLKQKWR